MLHVQAIDDLPSDALKEQFREARNPDYSELIREAQQLKPSAQGFSTQLVRLKRHFEELAEIDFFECPLRSKAEESLYKAEHPPGPRGPSNKVKLSKVEYQNRIWMTRPRPGIDRVSSAWIIKRFIDPNASFAFGAEPSTYPNAVPFDMYQQAGFGHEGDRCTFETLCARFGIKEKKVRRIGRAIHDADLEDERFGTTEGITINQILKGWAKQGVSDGELLRRGIELIEGLYCSIG